MSLLTRASLKTTTGLADELVEILSNKTKDSISIRRLEETAEDFAVINDKPFERLVKDKIISGDVSGLKLKDILDYKPMKHGLRVDQVVYSDMYPVLGNHKFTKAVCFRLLKPCKYYSTLYITIDNNDNKITGIYYTESYISVHTKSMIATENVYDDIEYIVNKLQKFR